MNIRHLLLVALCALSGCGVFKANDPKAQAPKATLRLTLLPQSALSPGKPATILVKLTDIKERSLVTEDELQGAQGEKFRLLVIDPMLSEYEYLHPMPTATRGVYSVSFTPKAPGGYHVWADVTPIGGAQEFVLAELGNVKKAPIDKSERHEINKSGYRFVLSFDQAPKTGDETAGSIRITDNNGNAVTAERSHLVGVYGDYRQLLRVEPTGSSSFSILPYKPGFLRLFARTTIQGKDVIAPFGVTVAPKS